MKSLVTLVICVFLVLTGAATSCAAWETAEPGIVKIPKLFGELKNETLTTPSWTNPFYDWVEFDTRLQNEKFDDISLFAQDQQRIIGDFSVQWKPNVANLYACIKSVGGMHELREKIVVQGFRSACREASKTITSSEDFFKQEGQERFQQAIMVQLQEYAGEYAIIERVMSHDMVPPEAVQLAIVQKKKAEQEVAQQRAILERQKLEAQQTVEIAKAAQESAQQEALGIRVLADAKAYELEQQAKALSNNPSLIPYQYLQKWDGRLPTFMTGDSPMMLNMPIKQ